MPTEPTNQCPIQIDPFGGDPSEREGLKERNSNPPKEDLPAPRTENSLTRVEDDVNDAINGFLISEKKKKRHRPKLRKPEPVKDAPFPEPVVFIYRKHMPDESNA